MLLLLMIVISLVLGGCSTPAWGDKGFTLTPTLETEIPGWFEPKRFVVTFGQFEREYKERGFNFDEKEDLYGELEWIGTNQQDRTFISFPDGQYLAIGLWWNDKIKWPMSEAQRSHLERLIKIALPKEDQDGVSAEIFSHLTNDYGDYVEGNGQLYYPTIVNGWLIDITIFQAKRIALIEIHPVLPE